MIVFTVLFTELLMPEKCKEILSEIMKFTNLDIIEAEPILTQIFGEFIPTDPYSEDFEELGYDSSNFFLECGPLMFIVIIFMLWAPVRKILQVIFKKSMNQF